MGENVNPCPRDKTKKEKIPDQKNRKKANKKENSLIKNWEEAKKKKETKFPIKDREKTEETSKKVFGPDNIWTIQNYHQVNKKKETTTTIESLESTTTIEPL